MPDVYFQLGEKVHHWLIDEFQDTSPLQWKILFPLVENSLASGGSLFVVGDTKQAIYGFRQADWRIMHQLAQESPFPSVRHHESPELAVSRRSRPRVLALAESVFRAAAGSDEPWGRRVAAASGLTTYRQEAVEPRPRPGPRRGRRGGSRPGSLARDGTAAADGARAARPGLPVQRHRGARRDQRRRRGRRRAPRGRRHAGALLEQPRCPLAARGGRGPRAARVPRLAARRPLFRGLPARRPVRRLGRPRVSRPRPRRRAAVPVREPGTAPAVQGVPARVPRGVVASSPACSSPPGTCRSTTW